MKRISALILCFLLLCGCSGGKEIVPKLKGISFTAKMTYYNEEYSFKGKFSTDGELVCEMLAPEGLSEMVFTVNDDKTITEYKGITYSPVEGSMPFAGVIEQFYSRINQIAADEQAVADKNGILKTEKATLTVSPTGFPQKLSAEKEGFSVNFYNITLLAED